jgi:hypothetical protein
MKVVYPEAVFIYPTQDDHYSHSRHMGHGELGDKCCTRIEFKSFFVVTTRPSNFGWYIGLGLELGWQG